MNYYYAMAALVIAGVLLLATACAPNRPYRTSFAPYNRPAAEAGQDPTNHAVIEMTPEYSLGFVEFDEEGWFWDPKQVERVEDMIRMEANVNGSNNAAGIVLLVFVHGWKNNAAYDCANVVTFRAALQQLNAAEQPQSSTNGQPARKIVGIYCGWRGLSSTWEPFKELTFWNRKATAHRVGGYGAMTQFFVQLQRLQELSNGTIKSGGPRTELIFVGHSFGAAAVYSAVSEFVTQQFVENLGDPKEGRLAMPLKPLGDQVILLSPAFEASRHYNLNRLATNLARYPDAQRPVLSMFTSKGDWATHYALPAGRFLATIFEKFQNAEQARATREAVGWFGPFVTHTLEYNTNSEFNANDVFRGAVAGSTFNPKTGKHEFHRTNSLRESIQNVEAQREEWIRKKTKPVPYFFDDSILRPQTNFTPGDPFLVVAVDKKIMKDHDDIDNPVLINFLREYIQFCRPGTRK